MSTSTIVTQVLNFDEQDAQARWDAAKPSTDWDRLKSLVEAQPTIAPRGHVKAGVFNGRLLILLRTRDDDLRGRFQGTGESFYIGYWGRDHNHWSSARSGIWKVSSAAERNFKAALR